MLREKLDIINNNIINVYTIIRDRIVDHISSIDAHIKAMVNSSSSINDVLTSSPEPSAPSFSDSLNESNKVETEIIDSTSTGKDEAVFIIGTTEGLIATYRNAFIGVSYLFSSFLSISIIDDLFTFSLAFGIFALITNLGLEAFTKENARSKAKKQNTSSKSKKGG